MRRSVVSANKVNMGRCKFRLKGRNEKIRRGAGNLQRYAIYRSE